MGICTSSDATHVATATATAKVVFQDGRLQEFPYPIKASYILQKNPACFICNSDEMEFDDVVSAISADEELQPGQLYFALPLTWLNHPLQAEEMAALAVKASAALMMKSGGDKCGCRRNAVAPLVLPGDVPRRRAAEGDGCQRKKGRVGGRKSYKATLNAIPE